MDDVSLSELPRALLATLRSLPGTRAPVWLVFEEDEYETCFGDGRFLYPRAAFLSEAEAGACLKEKREEAARRKEPQTLSYRYSLKKVEIVRDESRNLLCADLRLESAERVSLPEIVRLLTSPTHGA